MVYNTEQTTKLLNRKLSIDLLQALSGNTYTIDNETPQKVIDCLGTMAFYPENKFTLVIVSYLDNTEKLYTITRLQAAFDTLLDIYNHNYGTRETFGIRGDKLTLPVVGINILLRFLMAFASHVLD